MTFYNKPLLIKTVNETDPDIIEFLPPIKGSNQSMAFQMLHYEEKVQKLRGSELGDCYDIILFKLDEEGYAINIDRFEAILIEPVQYLANLLDGDWYGIIGRLTIKSHTIFDKLYNEITK